MAPVHADVSARIEDRRSGVTENPVSGKPRQNFFTTAANTGPASGDVGDSTRTVTRLAGKPLIPRRPGLMPEIIRRGKSDASGRLGAYRPGRRRVCRWRGRRHIDVCVSRCTISANPEGRGDGSARDVETTPEVARIGRAVRHAGPPCPVTSRSSDTRLCGISSDSIVFVSRSRRESQRGRRTRHCRPLRRHPRIHPDCHRRRRRPRRHFRRCR